MYNASSPLHCVQLFLCIPGRCWRTGGRSRGCSGDCPPPGCTCVHTRTRCSFYSRTDHSWWCLFLKPTSCKKTKQKTDDSQTQFRIQYQQECSTGRRRRSEIRKPQRESRKKVFIFYIYSEEIKANRRELIYWKMLDCSLRLNITQEPLHASAAISTEWAE